MNRPVIFASVGTDHHPFDRLVRWLDDVARRHGSDVHVVVQHGHSRAPEVAEGHEFLSYEKLVHLMDEADVVVCHAGPGTIMDARRSGKMPVCVGRDPELGEHVDGHQLRFVTMVAETGAVQVASDEQEFADLIDGLIGADRDERPAVRIPQQRQGSGIPVLAAELNGMLERPRRPRRLRTVGDYLKARAR